MPDKSPFAKLFSSIFIVIFINLRAIFYPLISEKTPLSERARTILEGHFAIHENIIV
jgi:hypothetical protein